MVPKTSDTAKLSLSQQKNCGKRTVLNPITKRQIKIGGPKWKEMTLKPGGYVAHMGQLVPINTSLLNPHNDDNKIALPADSNVSTDTNIDQNSETWHILTPTILDTTPSKNLRDVQNYLQKNYLFVNKPSRLNTVPSRGPSQEKSLTTQIQETFSPQVKPCHRLDRDTSGVVAYGLAPSSHRHLSILFQDRMIEKTYVALVACSATTACDNDGVISLPIGKEKVTTNKDDGTTSSYNKWVIDGNDARDAITEYRIDERWEEEGYVRMVLRPRTGRGHQLRLHMTGITCGGKGILGDTLHASEKGVAMCVPRLCLHAERLVFDLVVEGEFWAKVGVVSPAPF